MGRILGAVLGIGHECLIGFQLDSTSGSLYSDYQGKSGRVSRTATEPPDERRHT